MSSQPSPRPTITPVEPGTRLVHIGPHKTGSSAIQSAMHDSRASLAAHGVHYAGRAVRPRKAMWSLGVRGRPAGSEQPPLKHWKALLRDIKSAGGLRVCLSNEDLGRAEPEQIRRVVADLGGAGQVHVVAVARRFDRYLPSQWQERVKAGERAGYDEWLRTVLDRLGEPVVWGSGSVWERTNVQYAHDPVALANRWIDEVGPDRFTLVVSDESDRGFLLRVFEQLLGLPATALVSPDEGANQSLAWAEVEALASINAALADRGVSRIDAKPLVGRGIAVALKNRGARGDGPRTPPLPGWAADAVREFMDDRISTLQGMGMRVIGDVEQLRLPADLDTSQVDTPKVGPDDVAFMVMGVLEAVGWFERDQS